MKTVRSRRQKRIMTRRLRKGYTKSAKRTLRMKRKTRRMSRSKHMSRSKLIYRKMRGGADAAVPVHVPAAAPVALSTATLSLPSAPGPAVVSPTAAYTASGLQNAGNKNLHGGSNQRKKQSGGDRGLDLYAYAPPPGMMGPVPQTGQDFASNKLITQAAQLTVNGQANSQYDGNVGNVVNR